MTGPPWPTWSGNEARLLTNYPRFCPHGLAKRLRFRIAHRGIVRRYKQDDLQDLKCKRFGVRMNSKSVDLRVHPERQRQGTVVTQAVPPLPQQPERSLVHPKPCTVRHSRAPAVRDFCSIARAPGRPWVGHPALPVLVGASQADGIDEASLI